MADPRDEARADALVGLRAAHADLGTALATVAETVPNLAGASTDTLLAVGMAMGEIGKAKALLGRDIDNRTPRGLRPWAPPRQAL